jgi:hypothetical protein
MFKVIISKSVGIIIFTQNKSSEKTIYICYAQGHHFKIGRHLSAHMQVRNRFKNKNKSDYVAVYELDLDRICGPDKGRVVCRRRERTARLGLFLCLLWQEHGLDVR